MHRVRRFDDIPGFNIDRVAAAAGQDPEVLRLENLDTDIPPAPAALEATRAAIGRDEANSWLPFNGREDLKAAVVEYIARRGGPRYDPRREVVITCGEGEAMLDALFCLTDPGDEVIVTDPTYAGMINRVRLAGAVPRLVPLHAATGEWRLDLDALRAAVSPRTRVVFLNMASFPTGWVATAAEWEAIAALCAEHDLWLLYWAAFEAVLYDGARGGPSGRAARHARTHGDRGRAEQRAAHDRVADRLGRDARRVATTSWRARRSTTASWPAASRRSARARRSRWGRTTSPPRSRSGQRRRDETLRQLDGLPVVPPHGAWAALLDCEPLGLAPAELSARLLEHKVAATPMDGWGGEIAARHLRFVFSNEPVERLALLGDRVRAALAGGR